MGLAELMKRAIILHVKKASTLKSKESTYLQLKV
jgi:hypothetical protein